MRHQHYLAGLLLVLLAACTKADALVVTNAAADTCQLVELVTDSGAARTFCLAVDALDKLLPALLSAEKEGRGVELTVKTADGGEERFQLKPREVSALANRVGTARAKASRR
jgi:hypothetical protein